MPYEIEWFDNHLGKLIQFLEGQGELEIRLFVGDWDNVMASFQGYFRSVHVRLAHFVASK